MRINAFTLVEQPVVRKGFTLVELLVVITIIVILISLLVPALERAVYQAELAKCGVQMRTLASASNMYGIENKRFYPRPDAVIRSNPRVLVEVQDLRPLIRPYLPSINKIFNDPLVTEADYDFEHPLGQGHRAWTSRQYYAGWGFSVWPAQQAMNKMTDHMEYTHRARKESYRLRILVADFNERRVSHNALEAAHPDSQGTMSEIVNNNKEDSLIWAILSMWYVYGGPTQTSLDLNYAMQDESVIRFNNVVVNSPNENQDAEDLITAPTATGFDPNDARVDFRTYLPKP